MIYLFDNNGSVKAPFKLKIMTAVEWFGLIILEQGGDYVISVFEQAKEMEKQQIIDAWEDVGTDGVTTAEEYYENTFKNTKNDIKRTI